MTSHYDISIILPVYNVSPFLTRCLDSLLEQRCQNMEIIAVNDGSTDNSPEILERYRSRFTALRIIHQENKGLSEARNRALSVATGKYIYCVDSDDYIAPKCVETIVSEMERHQLDTLFFATHLESPMEPTSLKATANYFQRPRSVINKTLDAQSFFNMCIAERAKNGQGYSVVVWGYAWRRELYSGLLFQTRYYEDEYFTTALLLSCPQAKVRCIADRLYHHLLRSGSITSSTGQVKRTLAILDTFRLLLPLAGNTTDKKTLQSLSLYVDMLYLDAFTQQLGQVVTVFSAQKMIRFLVTNLHDLYIKNKTENGLVIMLQIVEKIVRDAELVNEKEALETLQRIRRAIDTKRELALLISS
ncbi:glycosyltransferase family 2 protein [Serratia quinivorans]|uniref:glycosyltransferase family 2 protein n=1 Tax=Serratia quinivorans TaxID=137545 RepID=UPI003982CAD7